MELLPGDEIAWLAQQIIEKRTSANFLSESEVYNLPTTMLYSYVKRIKNGQILRQDHGRLQFSMSMALSNFGMNRELTSPLLYLRRQRAET